MLPTAVSSVPPYGADGFGVRGTDRSSSARQGGPALQEEAPMEQSVSGDRFAEFFAKAALFRHRALPGSVSHLDSTALLPRKSHERHVDTFLRRRTARIRGASEETTSVSWDRSMRRGSTSRPYLDCEMEWSRQCEAIGLQVMRP